MMRAVVVVVLVIGCAPNLPASFACSGAGQCVLRGVQGTCEATGACSFPDTGCTSGRRYGDFGPPGMADQCVGGAVVMGDGGVMMTMPDLAGAPQISRIAISTVPLGAHGTTVTIATPASTAPGDFLLASILGSASGASVTPPSGWSVHAEVMGSVSYDFHATWLFKRAGNSEPASYDFQLAASADSAGAIVVYRGVATAMPIDVATNQQFEATTFTAPSITTTHANDMLVAAFVNAMSAGMGWGAPPGMQSAVNIDPIGIFDTLQPTPGPTGTKQPSLGFGNSIPGIGAVDFLALTP